MPILDNRKHEAFAQEVAKGTSLCDAYMKHVAKKGECAQKTAYSNGHKLASKTEIEQRIAELKAKLSEKVTERFAMTRAEWLAKFAEIAKLAVENEDLSAANGALREIGKAVAWYEPEKVEHSGSVGIPNLKEVLDEFFKAGKKAQ